MATAVQQEATQGGLQRMGLDSAGKGIVTFGFFILISALVIGLDRPPRPVGEQAPLSEFSAARAFRHLAVIARAPHPINSVEHAAVRAYIVGVLRGLGLNPEVQKTTDINESFGVEGALENIVACLPGTSQEKAVLLVSHYDSVPEGPGASDDGAAVAAVLETARALKSFPQLKRDIIFLFTDGEERGLLGARAFVAEHPWVRRAGIVLNFEARGIGGQSIMFETGSRNGWLIKNFSEAASHPVANSLSYEIYKRLPNNTDFTIFRNEGYSGLNFAFIDGLAYYHTAQDSLNNINMGSLQHHGDYVLELAKQFGNTAADDPKWQDAVYFDVLGWLLISYGQLTSKILLALSGVLLLFALYRGTRAGNLRIGSVLIGFACSIVGSVLTIGGAFLESWLVLGIHKPVIKDGLTYHGGWYVVSFCAAGLACAAAFYSLAAKRLGCANLTAGALVGWMCLAIAVSVYLPGGSYLFLWPLLFGLLGWLCVFIKKRVSWVESKFLPALSTVPALVVVVPLLHKIFLAFVSQSTLIVSTFAGFLFALIIGQIVIEKKTSKPWILPSLLGVAALGLLTAAIALSSVAAAR
jgi:Peptidase family M28